MADDKDKAVRLVLNTSEHRRLRAVAGGEGKSMARWVKDLVLAAIRPEAKGEAK